MSRISPRVIGLLIAGLIFLTGTITASAAPKNSKFITLDSLLEILEPIISTVDQHTQAITDFHSDIASLESEVASLSSQLVDLEQALANQNTPESFTAEFFQGLVSTSGASSESFEASAYTNLVVTYKCAPGEASLFVQVSADDQNWVTQYSADPNNCKAGDSVPLPVAGNYYKISMGSTTSPELGVTALGYFTAD